MTDRVKLFVGCSANGEDAESQAVLEYTVRKNSSLPVDIVWMKQTHNQTSPLYGWSTYTWATPFSGFRWAVPELCNFEGKAIYCDSDFIWLSDIAKLWNQRFQPGKVVMAKGGDNSWRYCSCLWDCSAAQEYLLPISRMKALRESHQRMMSFFSQNQTIVQPFEGTWNCIDGEDLPIDKIDALHYSSMSNQFHLKYAIPRLEKSNWHHWFDGRILPHWRTDLQQLFDNLLLEAESKGYTVENYLPSHNEFFGDYIKESQANYNNAHPWVR